MLGLLTALLILRLVPNRVPGERSLVLVPRSAYRPATCAMEGKRPQERTLTAARRPANSARVRAASAPVTVTVDYSYLRHTTVDRQFGAGNEAALVAHQE